MDIKFEVDNLKFNVRSSCIIKDKKHEKVLLSDMRGVTSHSAYILPGGRLEILEDSNLAVVRELKEELGVELSCKLISIEENFSKENKFHMIEFVYFAEVDDFNFLSNVDNSWDKFKIVNIDEIDKYDIRPKSIKNLIKYNVYSGINHNINYDWGDQ